MGRVRNMRGFRDEIAVELLGKNVGMGVGGNSRQQRISAYGSAPRSCAPFRRMHWPRQLPPQPSSPPVFQYQPTMQDVDPGIDHGNSDENVPYEFKKQMVSYRSQQPPGTVIIDTQERHLYLIQDPTHAIRYGIGVGRDGFTWQGCCK